VAIVTMPRYSAVPNEGASACATPDTSLKVLPSNTLKKHAKIKSAETSAMPTRRNAFVSGVKDSRSSRNARSTRNARTARSARKAVPEYATPLSAGVSWRISSTIKGTTVTMSTSDAQDTRNASRKGVAQKLSAQDAPKTVTYTKDSPGELSNTMPYVEHA
jgi:hypothetical protein